MRTIGRYFGPGLAVAAGLALVLLSAPAWAEDQDKEEIEELEKRIEKLEVKAAKDRIQFSGDLRVTADHIDATMAESYNGLFLQKGNLDTFFFLTHPENQTEGGPVIPGSLQDVQEFIGANYGDYLYFQDTLTFDQVKEIFGAFPDMIGSLPPDSQQALMEYMGALQQASYVPEQDYTNDIIYTTRLRLNMHAQVKSNISFTGRLSMYKTWGDSTGVQMFNGQTNSFTLDGTDSNVPNSDILRVERAFFDWKNIGGSNWYLSLGRRPSTGGPPLEMRENELRQGTPAGHVVNFQFDGLAAGIKLDNWLPGNVFRLCYGVGFESGWGSGDQLRAPADRLADVHLGGFNWDLYATDTMQIQTTVLGAWDVTDGFNGLIVLPGDPVSGNPIPAPVVLRYTPSANLGDIYLGNIVLERDEGPLSWFVSYAYNSSKANDVTTPFGGLFTDPFDTPEDHTGSSVYAGLRVPLGNNFLGFEYNHGSQYWFNFTQAADDLVGSKLATRGDAYEGYWIHEFKEGFGRANFKLRLGAIYYDYAYSGSGWQVGAPKALGGDEIPTLGFPTYDDALDVRLAFMAKF